MKPEEKGDGIGDFLLRAGKEKGDGIGDFLLRAGTEIVQLEDLFRETVMRANLALPMTEEELKWFDEGTDHKKSGDFYERMMTKLLAIHKLRHGDDEEDQEGSE